MKHSLGFIHMLSTAILLLFSYSTFAQISITNNDVLALMGVSQVVETDTTGSMTINVGSAGANQSWDFTGVSVQGYTLSTSFISPQGTPLETYFPSSNFVYSFTDTSGSEGYNEITFYNYIEVTATHFSTLGYGLEIPELDTSYVLGKSDDVAPLPITFNSSWVSTETDTTGDPAIFAIIELDTTTNTVDGWGTVQLPTGTFNCLRVRADNKYTQVTYIGGQIQSINITNTITYSWISKENFIVVEAESQDNDVNPNFTTAADFQRLVSTTTGIENQPIATLNPTSFQLFQNYPNPFNPSTTIRYQLPKSGNVVLSVYDIDGRLVKTLVDKFQDVGEYSISWDGQNTSSGIYFFRLDAGDFSAVKKGTLLK